MPISVKVKTGRKWYVGKRIAVVVATCSVPRELRGWNCGLCDAGLQVFDSLAKELKGLGKGR